MKKLTTEQWIVNAIKVHGNKYSYEDSVYLGYSSPITIICRVHGPFQQRPSDHTSGRGCSECSGVKRWNTEEFIERSKAVHGDQYLYDKAKYNGVHSNVTITCRQHGDFLQTAGNHTNKKHGCPLCAKINRDKLETKTTEQFIMDAKATHGNKYNYELSRYTHSHSKVKIKCDIHGVFEQVAGAHIYGSGCPLCSTKKYTSIGEQQVADYITSLQVPIIQNTRSVISPLELDIFIPSYNLAIEYCGLYWHSEQNGKGRSYHKSKHDMCRDKGIQLLTIFEDEWLYATFQVKNKIKSLLGKDNSIPVYARNTTVVQLTSKTKKEFLDLHHIQGNGPGSINLGLMHENELVACMSFIKQQDQHYLNRYATSRKIPGGFGKLLKYFQKNYKWNKLISFADQRWSGGNLYSRTGWKLDTIIPPDYSYIKGNNRIHKFNYRRKNLPNLLETFDPNKSEWENCKENNILRIWDCGKQRFVIQNPES